jgi:hypothetical protein
VITVWGDAGGIGQPSEDRSSFGSFLGGHAYRELALQLPEDGIEVNLDHQPGTECGSLVHAELGSDDRLRCVAVITDERLVQVLDDELGDEDLFFSPLLEHSGPRDKLAGSTYISDRAALIGLSITLASARVAPRPLGKMPGDVRDSLARYSWPLSWKQSPLLERAADVGLRERARQIVDLRPDPDVPPAWHGLREGDPAPAGLARNRPAGPWRHGQPGRILRVR